MITIVGAGITGATIARVLKDKGRNVQVVERLGHVGGNCSDYRHSNGLMMGLHGPHYFRTSSERIWEYAQRFAIFDKFEAIVKTLVGGVPMNWPIQESALEGCSTERFTGEPNNFEEAALSFLPREVYERYIKSYTEKQWGCQATQLLATLCKRFDIRKDDDPRLSKATYQGIPRGGYTRWITTMLDGIEVHLDTKIKKTTENIVWTGSIDSFYSYQFGRLRYRTQRRVHDVSSVRLPVVQINYPGDFTEAIRIIDWSHLPKQPEGSTVFTTEFPRDAETDKEREYPFPDAENALLYHRYRELAKKETSVVFAGRLGTNRYLDMDQAIGAALALADKL